MFKRILSATDRVKARDASVETAARLAASNHAHLRVLHVLESASEAHGSWVKHDRTNAGIDWNPKYGNDAARQIKKQYRDLLGSTFPFDIRIEIGCPWEEILASSREMGADLIVMGPHRSRAAEKGVARVSGKLGSTVEGVVTRENCPVMIVNRKLSHVANGFKNILVGIDFSAACECALCFSAKLASHYHARVFPFHMIPIPPFPKYSRDDYTADRKAAMEHLKYFCREYMEETSHDFIVMGGVLPHIEILDCAAVVKADLILMGSHTREKRGKWYPGSAVERVSIQSTCPVMVINDPEALQPRGRARNTMSDADGRCNRRIRVFNRGTRSPNQQKQTKESRHGNSEILA